MISFYLIQFLKSTGWQDGDIMPSEEEIQDACNAAYVAKQVAKQSVLDKLGITADEAALLLG